MFLLCTKGTHQKISFIITHIISLASSPMLLRSSISSTKKFFQKTLQNFKSFFSPGYQRLPKTPPRNNHFSYSVVKDMTSNHGYQELDKFYDQWDSEKEKLARRRSKKKAVLSSPTKQEKEVYNGSFISLSNNASPAQKKNIQMEKREEFDNQNNKRSLTHQWGRQNDSSFNSMGMREQRNFMVAQKLKELEMLDLGNVDYVLDIEEVLHYYSRLTCPAYLEIVDRFFMEMYSEFFGPAWPVTPPSVHSRLKLRYQ